MLDLDALRPALADALIELSAGRASMPPRIVAQTPEGGLLSAMPAYVAGVLESKLVSIFPGNRGSQRPSHQALIALFDAHHGTPLAILEGAEITAARTAAVSALATEVLARPDARVLTVLGAGVQARAHLQAVPRVRPFTEIRIADRTHAHAETLARDMAADAAGARIRAVADFAAAVRGADVVCACTDAPTPVIAQAWLSPGAHVTSIGIGGRELDAATIAQGRLVVESRGAFAPFPAGAHELQGLDPASAVELGEILAGSQPGRRSAEELTVFKSVGNAVEDAAVAHLVYLRALACGAGSVFEF